MSRSLRRGRYLVAMYSASRASAAAISPAAHPVAIWRPASRMSHDAREMNLPLADRRSGLSQSRAPLALGGILPHFCYSAQGSVVFACHTLDG